MLVRHTVLFVWAIALGVARGQLPLLPGVPVSQPSSPQTVAISVTTAPQSFSVVRITNSGSTSVTLGGVSTLGPNKFLVTHESGSTGTSFAGSLLAPPISNPLDPQNPLNYTAIVEHAVSTNVASGAAITTSIPGGSILRILKLTTIVAGAHDLIVMGGNGLTWHLFDVGVSGVWRRHDTAIASGPVNGTGIVLTPAIGTYALVVTRGTTPIADALTFTARLAPTTTHLTLPGAGTSVGSVRNATHQFTCTPPAFQWTAVGIRGTTSNSYTIRMDDVVVGSGPTSIGYLVANGRAGTVSPTEGLVFRSGTLTQANTGTLHQSAVSFTQVGSSASVNWTTSQILHIFDVAVVFPNFYDINITGPAGLSWAIFPASPSNDWIPNTEAPITGSVGTPRTLVQLSSGNHALVISKVSPSATSGPVGCLVSTSANLPAPTLNSVAPNLAAAGGPTFTMVLTGTGFVSGFSTVRWAGTPLATTFINGTMLEATVPANLIEAPGMANVTVFTGAPGGGTSAPVTFVIQNPTPILTAVSGGPLVAGEGPFALTLDGGNFNTGTIARLGGADIPTAFVDSNRVTATVPAGLLTTPGSVSITAFNPSPGGGTSNPISVAVEHPVPVLTSVTPGSLIAGSASTVVIADGAKFLSPSCVVRWNGTPLATTLVSATQLSAQVPAGLLIAPGTATVTVFHGGPGGGQSQSLSVVIKPPTLSVVGPLSIPVLTLSSSPISLLISGADFLPTATVYADSTPLPTVFFNEGLLLATLGPSVPGATRPGGVAIAIENGHFAPSNARAVAVGPGSNRGTIVRHPLNPLPGEAYAVSLEGGTALAPLVLLVDAQTPAPILPFPNAAGDFVLSVRPFGTPESGWFVLLDSIGLFSSAFGPTLDASGRLLLPGFAAPNPSLGISLTVQSAFLDPAAPLGFHLSTPRFPDQL